MASSKIEARAALDAEGLQAKAAIFKDYKQALEKIKARVATGKCTSEEINAMNDEIKILEDKLKVIEDFYK